MEPSATESSQDSNLRSCSATIDAEVFSILSTVAEEISGATPDEDHQHLLR